MNEHEEQIVRAFTSKRFQEKCLWRGSIERSKLWHELAHQLEESRSFELPNNLHVPERIIPVLRRFTSIATGYCISAHEEWDGRAVEIDAMPEMEATVVSIVPGRVAYYQGEYELNTARYLLLSDPKLSRTG